MNVVLISTYELGRPPFGLASPAAWLREQGAEVTCLDLSRERLREKVLRAADMVAFYVPMHTATRLAVAYIEVVRRLNPGAHLCFYGLYAPMNEALLREHGVQTILGGEFEAGLAALVRRLGEDGVRAQPQAEPLISLERLNFRVPERSGLPPLGDYARVQLPGGGEKIVGYTEASRGCRHLCRHCPIVPVYKGVFRVVPREVVLEDIRQQVAAGAEHITFGDPDFLNGPGHALGIVEALHHEFPELSYDFTAKVEHLRKHTALLPGLRESGCLFVTTAAESIDDEVLRRFDKGHTCADFLTVVEEFERLGLALHPTFIPFTPWTTLDSYLELLRFIAANGLVENVAPIQLGIRLLIPAGSRLLELEEVRAIAGPFDGAAMVHPWRDPDEGVGELCGRVQDIVQCGERLKLSRTRIFKHIWAAARSAGEEAGASSCVAAGPPVLVARAAIPYLNEPWYC